MTAPVSQSADSLPDIGTPTTADTPARIVWRKQYDYARDAIERRLSDSVPEGESMTEQHHADNADLNIQLARMGVTDGAKIPANLFAKVDPSYYGDFSNAVDLHTALEQMREAERRFMELPAELRAKFDNKWANLHEWINDGKNLDEAIRLKMLTPPEGWVAPENRKPPIPTPPASTPATT